MHVTPGNDMLRPVKKPKKRKLSAAAKRYLAIGQIDLAEPAEGAVRPPLPPLSEFDRRAIDLMREDVARRLREHPEQAEEELWG